MKGARLAALLVAGTLAPLPAALEAQFLPQNPSFEKPISPAIKNLRSLVGCWKGMGPHGRDTRIFYSLASDGTALVEHLKPADTASYQLTVYYIDGETPVAQHFCYYGSQIRMRAEPSTDPNVILFRKQDGTNLVGPHDEHMTYIKLTFRDQDHLEADWGNYTRGKEEPGLFSLARVVEGCKGLDFNGW